MTDLSTQRLVTQQELQELRELQAQNRRYTACRERVLAKLLADSSVETGPLKVRLRESPRHSVSFGKLIEFYGVDWTSQLKAAIAPTICRRIEIYSMADPI